MAVTMESLDSLYEELASADAEVQAEGRSIKFRTPAQIKESIDAIRSQLQAQGLYVGPKRHRMIRIASSSGF